MNYLYNLIKNKFPNKIIFPLNIYEYLNNYESFDIFEAFCALERSEYLNKEIVVWSQYSPNKKESLFLCEIDVGIDLISNNDYSYIGQCKNYSEKGYVCARDIERTLLCAHHSRYYLKNFDIFKNIEIISPLNVTLGKTKLNHQGEFNHILLDKIELSNKWMIKLNNTKFNEEKSEFINDLQLRECQKKVLDYIKENPDKKIIKISLPCGSGKTLIAIKWLSDVPCSKWLILVPSILLADQIYDYLIDNKIYNKNQIGLCYDGKTSKSDKIICVYNSFFKIKDRNFSKVFVDESHHILNKGINGKITSKERESYLDEIKSDLFDLTKDRKILFMSATMRSPDFKYSLREAIEDKILVDYYVHIPIYTGNYEKALIEYFKNRLYLYSILAFCNNIENAKKFSEMCVKEGLTSSWISGEMKQANRKEILSKFQKGETRILVSVKVLGEGINIRCANTCAFVQPKHSYYQIIQNCGRIFRECEGKESAHIILPGINQDDFDGQTESLDENSCKMYDFIKALGNEDYILKESILKNSQRLILDKIEPKKGNADDEEDTGNNESEIIREIIINSINSYGETIFDEWCKLLKKYIKEFNKLPILKTDIEYDGKKIGQWLRHTRKEYNKGLLKQLKIDKLNNINTDILKVRYKTFEQWLILLKEYIIEFNKVPSQSSVYKNENLGKHIERLRTKYSKNKLSEEYIKILDELHIEILNPITDYFDIYCKALEEYILLNNKLPVWNITYNDLKIGEFMHNQRGLYRKNKLLQYKVDKLNKLDSRVLNPTNIMDFKLNLVKEYIKEYDKVPTQNTIYKNINLGNYISGRRYMYKNNKLTDKQIKEFNNIHIEILHPTYNKKF